MTPVDGIERHGLARWVSFGRIASTAVAASLVVAATVPWMAAADQPPQEGVAAEATATAESAPLASQSGASELLGQPGPSAADIQRWVAQLGADDYAAREHASERLRASGAAAIDAVQQAAAADDLEISARAIRVLGDLLLAHDFDTQTAAEEALSQVAASQAASAADMAMAMLRYHQQARQQRAMEEIRRQGGEASWIVSSRSDLPAVQVVLGGGWTGKASELALLRRLPNLERLSLRGVRLDEAGIQLLAELGQLTDIELYGTGVSEAEARRLAGQLPQTRIDRRNGALLGVSGHPGLEGCQITLVQPGSAAEAAGLLAGDIIARFDGQAVRDFEELTALIAAKQGGERATLEVFRDGRRLERSVTLGYWR